MLRSLLLSAFLMLAFGALLAQSKRRTGNRTSWAPVIAPLAGIPTLDELYGDRIPFTDPNGKYGYRDRAGVVKIAARYDRVQPFFGGYAAVVLDGKHGIIDVEGKVLVPAQYDNILEVRPVFFQVPPFNGEGVEVGPAFFVSDDSSYRLAAVQRGDKWGFVNGKGQEVVAPTYDRVDKEMAAEKGLVRVWRGDSVGLVDLRGEEVLATRYGSLGWLSGGRVSFSAPGAPKGPFGYLDAGFREVIVPAYERATEFRDGYARVQRNGKWGVIDSVGSLTVPFEYDQLGRPDKTILRAGKNGKFGFVNTTGAIVYPFVIDTAYNFFYAHGRVVVASGGKWGVLDLQGKEVLPLRYDKVEAKPAGIVVQQGGKWGLFSLSGQELYPVLYTRTQEVTILDPEDT